MATGVNSQSEGDAGQEEWRLYLEDQQQQEVDVSQAPELLQEVEWQEGEQVVPGGLDGIALDQRLSQVRRGYVRSGKVKVNSIQALCVVSTLTGCRPIRLKSPSLARRCRSSGNTEDPSHRAT